MPSSISSIATKSRTKFLTPRQHRYFMTTAKLTITSTFCFLPNLTPFAAEITSLVAAHQFIPSQFFKPLTHPSRLSTLLALSCVMIRRSASVTALISFIALAQGVLLHSRDIDELTTDTFDYVVVGCGISGLVVTNRLSEDPTRTVLCIEAGQA